MSSDDSYQKALDLLARRPHFRRVLAGKLTARGFEAAEVDATCRRLEENGLLDDLECSKQMIAGAWRRRGYGRTRIRAELERRGVEGAVIEQALEASLGDELGLAEATARSWLRRSRGNRDSLARHLARKGYGAGMIIEVLRLLEDELSSDGRGAGKPGNANEEQ